eukprot:TRINITY_DN3673_c0_g3_i1.p1 TRINITY_DN3673_c0_g3~~TRINITY_DN3673_c0_g3_i1.p1  ORF type:complete len:222 (+),score=37.58 TRINITY_DN3673_c0_g3_i1:63-668(+)
MGLKFSSRKNPTKKEILDLVQDTHFTEEEVFKLFEHFKSISASIESDGVIDMNEFQEALGLRNSVFAQRIFQIFDINRDNVVNFKEFVCGLSVFCTKGTVDEKLTFSFKLYDADGDGYISKEELYGMLKASLFDNIMLAMPEQHMRALVDQTFTEADENHDGFISLEEYRSLVMRHPTILNNFTINTDQMTSNSSSQIKSK